MTRRKTSAEPVMPASVQKRRCAVYTRKSTDEGLEKEFNTLDAQREACEAYIASQRAEGWVLVPHRYDDGGFSGGSLERPALQRLLRDIEADQVDVIVVYKIDRLSRSLMDFAKLVEVMDAHGVTFVSVTQSFNTTTSMGRLTLNILLSFAQFEREVIGERTGGDDILRRISAAQIEGAVIGQVRALLRQPEIVAGGWLAARQEAPDLSEEDARDALARLDPLWEELFPAEQQRIIHALVERVVVGPTGADIRLRVEGLGSLARELGQGGRAA